MYQEFDYIQSTGEVMGCPALFQMAVILFSRGLYVVVFSDRYVVSAAGYKRS